MRVSPPKPRSTIRQTTEGLEVVIPSKRNFFSWGFLTIWLVLWGVGESVAARELLSGSQGPPDLFTGGWLVLWTSAGGFLIYVWLWTLAGREIIRLRDRKSVV